MSADLIYSAAGQPNALGDAVGWGVALLTGSLATSIGVLAIAGVGLAMLLGEVSVRQGMRVVAGCFILFGASSIAHGLMTMANGAGSAEAPGAPAAVVATSPPPSGANPNPFDPYAGASVP